MFSPFTYDPMQQASGQYYSGMTGQFMPNTGFNRPTYGQFGTDYEHMMATPYGSQFMAPSSNIYYSTMVAHPFKSFLTYKLPVFSAPKGLNPVAFDRYYSEAQAQGSMSIASFGIGMAATSLGARMGGAAGGPVGALIGAGLGMAVSPFITHGYTNALSKAIQIHEASNLLNTTEGGNQFGFGLSMGQSIRMYRNMTSAAKKDTNFSPEEAQLTFSELARNSLIDDSGDFTQIKGSFRKMKNVVEKLRDLFNGDIKQVVHSLRQLSTAGVDNNDLASVSVTMGLAAAQMGQNTADYATNSINTAIQRSAQTGFSKSVSMQLGATLDSVTDIIGKATGNIYGNHISSKEKTRRFKDDFFNTIQATTFGPLSNILLANNMMGSGQYVTTSLEAGIQEYNKENGTNYSYRDVVANKGLQKKIWEKYANPAMQKLEKEYNGNYSKIFNELSKKDSGYMLAMTDQNIMSHDLKEMSAKEVTTQTFRYFSKFKNVLPKFLEETGLEKINPEMYESVKRVMGAVKNNPNIYSDIMNQSRRRAELFAEKNKSLQQTRIYSGQGLWESAKAHVKDFYASGLEMFAGKKEFVGTLAAGNTPSSSIRDLYKYSKGFNLDKLSNMTYNSDYINDTSFAFFRPISRMFGDKKISDASQRMKYLMGDGWVDFNYGSEDVKKVWSYQLRRTRGYSKGLKQVSKLEKGDLSGLDALDELSFSTNDGGSMIGSSMLVSGSDRVDAISKKIAETTKEVIKGVKEAVKSYNKILDAFSEANGSGVANIVSSKNFTHNLAEYERKIHGLKGNDWEVIRKANEKGYLSEDAQKALKHITGKNISSEQLDKLLSAKEKMHEKAQEARLQYIVGEGGVQGLLRDMGYKGTTTYQGAKNILETLKNNDTLRDKFLSNIQSKYNINREAAEKVYSNLMEYDKDNSKKRMQSNALTFNTIGEMKFSSILKNNAISKFYKFSGVDSTIKALNSEGGDINKLRKDLLSQAELDKKMGDLSEDEGAGGLRTLVGGVPTSAQNLFSSIKSFIKENGGEIKINGHKYTSAKDLIEDKTDFNDFIKGQAALGFGAKISEKLGLNALDPKKALAIQDVISRNFKYDDKSKKWILRHDLSKKDREAVTKDLEELRIGKGSIGLNRISEALNGGTDSLKTTNTILNRIYNVLTSIDENSKPKVSNVAKTRKNNS